MAISYPLNVPTSIGLAQIAIRTANVVAVSQSPFTFKQQVVEHQGQRWEASVSIPPVRRDLAADWKAFLTALKGPVGTFLLGDPDYTSPRGTVSSCTLTGSAGDESVTVSMSGSLLAGDYIQLGSGSSTRLHQVLEDKTGSGTLEIWPKLRSDYTSASVTFNSPKCLFRLSSPVSQWEINSSSIYGISFDAVEALV